jgi:hypothetical protein
MAPKSIEQWPFIVRSIDLNILDILTQKLHTCLSDDGLRSVLPNEDLPEFVVIHLDYEIFLALTMRNMIYDR